MEYNNLDPKIKQAVNGTFNQFKDVFIRKNKAWSRNQLLEEFMQHAKAKIEEYNRNYAGKVFTNMPAPKNPIPACEWILSNEGKKHILEISNKEHVKYKEIAERKSIYTSRLRFGDKRNYYDIKYGLKNVNSLIKIEDYQKLDSTPWTVGHINSQLNLNYNLNLEKCLQQLSTSYIEQIFANYWIKNFYHSSSNVALIPEVSGLDEPFWYYQTQSGIYSNPKDSPEYGKLIAKNINFRFDFMLINVERQKVALIELDGFDFHKTKEQQTIDSIKRNKVSKLNIPLFIYTSEKVTTKIDDVFSELREYMIH